MQNQSTTPGSMFSYILSHQTPAAMAWVRGGSAYPAISGLVKFYETPYQGVLVEAEFFNLPNVQVPGSSDYYAFHIHENGDCSNDFTRTGEHFSLPGQMHPFHNGDFPPLLSNQGYAWLSFYDKRFTVKDILGRSVVVHIGADDFHSQPSGNSGAKIACGVIRSE